MDQSMNQQQHFNMNQVPGHGYFIKQEPIDSQDEKQLPNVMEQDNRDQPQFGGESHYYDNEEVGAASHLHSHHQMDESGSRMSSASFESKHGNGSSSAGSSHHSNDVVNGQVNLTTDSTVQLPINLQQNGHHHQPFGSHHSANDANSESSDDSDINDYRHEYPDGEEHLLGDDAPEGNASNDILPNDAFDLSGTRAIPHLPPSRRLSRRSNNTGQSGTGVINGSRVSVNNRNKHTKQVDQQEQPVGNISVGNRSSSSLSNDTICSAQNNQSCANLLNQLPTHSRANLQPSIMPPRRIPSGAIERPADRGLINGNLVVCQLKGRFLNDPRFRMGFDGTLNGEFEGRFDINGTVNFDGTFNGVQKQLLEVEFAGAVYGKFGGIFCGKKLPVRDDIFLFGGKFTGYFNGKIVGKLDDVYNNKPIVKDEDDEDDKSKIKSAIQVIEFDKEDDHHDQANFQLVDPLLSNEQANEHQRNDRDVGDTSNDTAPTNREMTVPNIEDDSFVDNGNRREDDFYDDFDDSQTDLSDSEKSSDSYNEISNNELDMADQQPQSQRRASVRIVTLEKERSSKRAKLQELPKEIEQGIQANENVNVATSRDIASISSQDDSTEDDDDEDVDDNQSDPSYSTESSASTDNETLKQQTQFQRRALKKRASKRAHQEQLSDDELAPEEKLLKFNDRDNRRGRRTISVQCFECNQKFKTFVQLDAHQTRNHQLARYLCFVVGCANSFESLGLLVCHIRTNHPKTTINKYACRIQNCKHKIKNQEHASIHFKKHIVGQFECTFCTCHCEMIDLTTAQHRFNQTQHSSTSCNETRKCGQIFDRSSALKAHQKVFHQTWDRQTLLRCKQDTMCAFTRNTMSKHLRAEHKVHDIPWYGKEAQMKALEKYTETMTKAEVRKAAKLTDSTLVPTLDLFRPSTSGTQRTTHRSFNNQYHQSLYDDDDDGDDDDDDDDEDAYRRAVPSTSRKPPSHGKGNQSRIQKTVFKDLTKK